MEQFEQQELSKAAAYEYVTNTISSLLKYEHNMIANMANICAVLTTQFKHWWVGFYLVDTSTNELVLGPFQGPLACTRIGYGKGVCGAAWATQSTQVVPNVHEFPGHIACSSATNSEIVVPLKINGTVWAVLDIDSVDFNTFDTEDQQYLEAIAQLISDKYSH